LQIDGGVDVLHHGLEDIRGRGQHVVDSGGFEFWRESIFLG
jgi:hypothetical protein